MQNRAKGRRAIALVACLGAGLAAGGAHAQDVPSGCVASGNPNGAVAGAVVGGLAGALLGNALSGRHHKAPGTIVGGATGALAGAAIGGSAGGNPCPQGYVYQAAPPPADERPLPIAREGEFWYGAPPHIHERIIFLRRRVEKLDGDGWLSPRESEGLLGRLTEISHREEAIRNDNDGELPPRARERLNNDLNDVARHLRWKEYQTEHADE